MFNKNACLQLPYSLKMLEITANQHVRIAFAFVLQTKTEYPSSTLKSPVNEKNKEAF
jgi:hypothetical protein